MLLKAHNVPVCMPAVASVQLVLQQVHTISTVTFKCSNSSTLIHAAASPDTQTTTWAKLCDLEISDPRENGVGLHNTIGTQWKGDGRWCVWWLSDTETAERVDM